MYNENSMDLIEMEKLIEIRKPMFSLYRRLDIAEEDINGLEVNMRKLSTHSKKKPKEMENKKDYLDEKMQYKPN